MNQFTLKEHILALKSCILVVVLSYFLAFALCYLFSESLLYLLLKPLVSISSDQKIIYTDLSEAFWAHLRAASFFAFLIIYPICCYQIYNFISPGLYSKERKIACVIFFCSPVLFYLGGIFLYYIIIPNAWGFFMGYETKFSGISVSFEAKISEYLDLFFSLIWAFGAAFQLPVLVSILSLLGIVKSTSLKAKRRLVVVVLFIVSAIFTPPDVLSQIALAIPLVLLYEFSILISITIEKRLKDKC